MNRKVMKMKCNSCGEENQDINKFCYKCGNKLQNDTDTEIIEQNQQQQRKQDDYNPKRQQNNKTKKICLVIIALFAILILGGMILGNGSTEVKLNDGSTVNIPKEYNVNYKDISTSNMTFKSVPTIETKTYVLYFYPKIGGKLTYGDMIYSVPSGRDILVNRELNIGDKHVTEIIYESSMKGYPMTDIYVEKNGKTLLLSVDVLDWDKWDLEKSDNPVHKLIKNCKF